MLRRLFEEFSAKSLGERGLFETVEQTTSTAHFYRGQIY